MKKPKMSKKDKLRFALQVALICVLIAVIFGIIGIKIYVMWEFSDVPISEVPSWAFWWLGGSR